ncbi:MAG TPA: protein tyrosine phosphatase [Roseiflexaceae bacterium]|nr:protein tyrosine phosphatase [Roseiflexaceae bacterium]
MTTILLIGAADTGRAPMAAALLRRLLDDKGHAWQVGSAGVLGHDDDPPEIEARDAMAHMGLDIGEHRARSLNETLIAEAALLVAIDSGIARVVQTRFPEAAERTRSLGELAGRGRDIPDPFRMQMGAWLTYARELDTLIQAALPRMAKIVEAARQEPPAESAPARAEVVHDTADAAPASERAAAVGRMLRLLTLASDMPHVLNWAAARAQLESDIATAAKPIDSGDLSAIYADLARAVLALSATPPTVGQIGGLRSVAERFSRPVRQEDLTWLSGRIATWAAL